MLQTTVLVKMPADGMSAATTKWEFGTSRWQLADKNNIRACSIQRWSGHRKVVRGHLFADAQI
jgi:hypothetical protein